MVGTTGAPRSVAVFRRVLMLGVIGTLGLPASSAGAHLPEGPSPRLRGCDVFPANNWWNADITDLPVHPRSDDWMSHMSTERALHPDFGPSEGAEPDYGTPITVVRSTHRKVRVRFDYASESDRGRYPLGHDTRIEGGRNSGGDMHAVIVDRDRCRLYETFHTQLRDGRWTAASGATWSLRSNRLRPDGWTSADAAGLPILPGLLRWQEVRAGRVEHAIRFTTDATGAEHLWPARHHAGSDDGSSYPPMGARFRLRSDYPVSGLSPHTRAVVTAMKTHGLVLADNGSPWYFQGEQNPHWPERMLAELKRVPASAFEAVDTGALKVSPDSGEAVGQ